MTLASSCSSRRASAASASDILFLVDIKPSSDGTGAFRALTLGVLLAREGSGGGLRGGAGSWVILEHDCRGWLRIQGAYWGGDSLSLTGISRRVCSASVSVSR